MTSSVTYLLGRRGDGLRLMNRRLGDTCDVWESRRLGASASWPVGCEQMAVRPLYRRSDAANQHPDMAYGEPNEEKPRELG